MKRKMLIAALFALAAPAQLLAAEEVVVTFGSPEGRAAQTAEEIAEYWTEEQMANAQPVPVPAVVTDPAVAQEGSVIATEGLPADANPALMPGWDPTSGGEPPTADDMIVPTPDHPLYPGLFAAESATYGSPPSHPVDYSNYGPYQRWTWYGRYLTFPTSVIGKLFFTKGGSNYVCSGTVINRSTVITAAHCVSDGAGNFATNLLFCPSYNKADGVNPSRGCWAYSGVIVTTSDFHYSSDTDRDYACFVTNPTGTSVSNNIGNVTGWAGWAVNWPSTQMVMMNGYPSASPFVGSQIVFTAAPEWYTVDMDPSDSNRSKYIGNDQRPGTSGGGWWLSIRHPTDEYPDVDGSNTTDPVAPSGPYVNGVNSHYRCKVSCYTPPTSGSGTYWSEMGSPQFTASASDPRDVLDILDTCYAYGGN